MNNRFVSFLIFKDWLKRRVFQKSKPIRDTWAEVPENISDLVEFLNWFDKTSSVEETVCAAERDWQFRFAAMPHFDKVTKGTALEKGDRIGNWLWWRSSAISGGEVI